jgi:hypothetical protein
MLLDARTREKRCELVGRKDGRDGIRRTTTFRLPREIDMPPPPPSG